MRELEIPDEAEKAAHAEYDDAMENGGGTECEVIRAVRAAAPFIVAAELARLIDEAFPDEISDWYYGLESLHDAINSRISELRAQS